jgi:hypothetical protein
LRGLKTVSVGQPLNFAPAHSIKRMHHIAFVQDGEQALDRAHGVALARRYVFRKDTTRILHGTQYRFLIGCTQAELLETQPRTQAGAGGLVPANLMPGRSPSGEED